MPLFTTDDEDDSFGMRGPRKSMDVTVLSGTARQQYVRQWQRKSFWTKVKDLLKSAWNWFSTNCLTFLYIHAAYFISLAFLGSFIIWLIERKRTNLAFIDSLFNGISAVASCGLTTADISKWSTSSLIIAFVLMELGSICFSTCLIVPFARYRRVKALAQRRIDHIEAQDAEEAGEITEEDVSSQEDSSDDSSSDDDEIVSAYVSERRFGFGSNSNLTRTVSSVKINRPSNLGTAPTGPGSKTSDSSNSEETPGSTPSVSSSRKIIVIEEDDDDNSELTGSVLHTFHSYFNTQRRLIVACKTRGSGCFRYSPPRIQDKDPT